MDRQRPVVRNPFMIIGGHNDSRDGEIIYQDCFYGRLRPVEDSLLLPERLTEPPKVIDMDNLIEYGTAVHREDDQAYRLFKADCVTMYSVSEHPWTYGAKEAWRYWFYRSAHDFAYKERYTNDEIWQRLHGFYKSLDE